jgi:TPR repeat protein
MRNFLAAFALTFCLAAPALAGESEDGFEAQDELAAPTPGGEFEEGLAAYDKGDYITAFMMWIPAAVHGNAVAQFNIGVMTLEGKGSPPNPVQGLAWILMAVENMPDGENRKVAMELRDKVTAILTPEEIKKAEDLKQQWINEHKEALKMEADGMLMQAPLQEAPLPGQLSMPTLIPGLPMSEQPNIDFGKPEGKEAPKDVPPAETK